MPAGILPQNEEPYSTLVNDSPYAANMKGKFFDTLFDALCRVASNETV